MNQISADHEKLRNVLISKLGLPTDRFQRDNLIAEAVKELIKERDDALQLRKAYNSNVKDWHELCGYFNLPVSTLSDVLSEIDTIRKERDEFRTSLSELSYKNEQNVCELDAYRAGNHPDLKPQLSEIRYVLHGDIQPCSVLYSDDTTTLLRLDEGDMMCETDTIEWSDSVTYRCQELLRASQGKQHVSVAMVKAVAQLVRDERILLNDNGDDEAVEIHTLGEKGPRRVPSDRGVSVVSCASCTNVYPSSLDLCPQCHTQKQER
ncbi:hypothetical protein SIPHO076v1_p0069 [Vibrio phage PS34B.1]|nr:hypothetical protein SIPHO076v1_p0069 [Vibrio phage PS34B.1]